MKKNINVLPYMIYGDALGFLKENTYSNNCIFQPFSYRQSESLLQEAEKGQWSYITQLTLINCKCFIDNKDKKQVTIDYKRLIEEIKLWKYYSYGMPLNYLYKLKLGKNYYECDFYWNDKRGETFSRIIPIALVNKNYSAAREEAYKNIIYINRHPQVIITGLLLLRVVYLLLKDENMKKDELIYELKNYLIHMQLLELEEHINTQLPNNYKIKFEQEKINYLISLDRLNDPENCKFSSDSSKDIFLKALINFFELYYVKEDLIKSLEWIDKEVYTITYGLLGIIKKIDEIKIDEIKDISFIKNMNQYLFKLREYEIGRSNFERKFESIDIFNLNKGDVLKHPLLNNIKIKEKNDFGSYIELILDTKTGEYKLIREKK